MTVHTQPVDQDAADCGHTLVLVDGEWQHHEIPDDGAPHAATSECGCGPQRHSIGGHVVYAHVDQDLY